MEMHNPVIEHTKKWINNVIIGCNFCPFAAAVIKQQTVHYRVETSTDANICLQTFLQETMRLDENGSIETSFIIFPNNFQQFG